MNIEQIRAEYAKLSEEVNTLKKTQDTLKKDAEKLGFFFKNGKFLEDTKEFIAKWDLQFYSHFDGHSSDAIYDLYEGSDIPEKESKKAFDVLVKVLKEDSTLQDEELSEAVASEGTYANMDELMNDLMEVGKMPWVAAEVEEVTNWVITLDEATECITLCYSGGEDQGELCDESEVVFGMMPRSAMIPCKEDEQRG